MQSALAVSCLGCVRPASQLEQPIHPQPNTQPFFSFETYLFHCRSPKGVNYLVAFDAKLLLVARRITGKSCSNPLKP